uniref:Cadherin domain-containing protein n=1 Tax=Petromyzon marinus TaxID=7757 RepID=S4RG52_PETMA
VNLLDFETLNQYNMTVSVTNVNGTSSEVFFIEVTDVNEPPICSDQSPAGAHIHILEDAPHATIVYRVRATDPDHGDIISLVFILVSSKSGFSSSVNFPLVIVTQTLSRFILQNFLLDIMVKDQNGLSCNLTLTVTVVNLDDNDLVFTTIPVFCIKKISKRAPSERVFWISEEEPQDHLYTLHLLCHLTAHFMCSSSTGEVKTAFKLDVDDKPELQNNYILVRATNYIHQRSVTLSLTVYVMDINDNPPVCSYYQRILQIPETTPVNYAVVDVSCTDRDVTSPNNVLIYSLSTDANSEGRFIMTEATLKINSSLDYDTADLASVDYKYNLKIEVYDLGDKHTHTATVTVIVVVTPVNEFSPICTGPVRFSIFEDQEVGDSVSPNKPSCTDQDYPLDNLRYSMIDDSAHFYIDPKTGIIQLLNPVDRETKATYRVTIKVEDFDQDTDTTNDLNVNDEPPVCDPGIYDITIYSTLAAGGSVVQLKCDDVDSLDGELEYGIIRCPTPGNTNGRFVLSNAKPPSVLTLSTFSYFNLGGINDPQDFQLLVKISDEGLAADKTRRLSSTATVLIHVVPWITTAPTTVTTTVRP